jgi:hypothetical protein
MDHLIPTIKLPADPEARKALLKRIEEHNKEFRQLLDAYLAEPSGEAAKRVGDCARQGRKDGLRSEQR